MEVTELGMTIDSKEPQFLNASVGIVLNPVKYCNSLNDLIS